MSFFQIRLKTLRKNKGLSQQAFANSFGVAQSTVGSWEAGKRKPNFETIKKLSEHFDVSIGYLLGIDESPTVCYPSLEEYNTRPTTTTEKRIRDFLSNEAAHIGKAFDKASEKDKNTVRQVLNEYMEASAATKGGQCQAGVTLPDGWSVIK